MQSSHVVDALAAYANSLEPRARRPIVLTALFGTRKMLMSVPLRKLGNSGLTVAPLAFGGNVFGWTADEATSCPRRPRGDRISFQPPKRQLGPALCQHTTR